MSNVKANTAHSCIITIFMQMVAAQYHGILQWLPWWIENVLKDAVMDDVGSLQTLAICLCVKNSLKPPHFTKEGCVKLAIVGLPNSEGGKCDECGNSRSLVKNNDRNLWSSVETH